MYIARCIPISWDFARWISGIFRTRSFPRWFVPAVSACGLFPGICFCRDGASSAERCDFWLFPVLFRRLFCGVFGRWRRISGSGGYGCAIVYHDPVFFRFGGAGVGSFLRTGWPGDGEEAKSGILWEKPLDPLCGGDRDLTDWCMFGCILITVHAGAGSSVFLMTKEREGFL